VSSPLIVGPDSHLVLMEYEAWFGPKCANFAWSAAQPILQSASMQAAGLAGYDSSDPAVIAQHVAWFEQMGIDAVLIDMSNDLVQTFLGQEVAGNASVEYCQAIQRNIAAVFQQFAALGTNLKIVPLCGGGMASDYTVGPGFKTALQLQLEWFGSLFAQFPQLAIQYLGKPLLCCYMSCPDIVTSTPFAQVQSVIQACPQFTVRLVGGFLDSQSNLWQTAAGLAGLPAMRAPLWSWVERYNPAAGLRPTYVPIASGAENLTVSLATPGAASWGTPPNYDPADDLRDANCSSFRAAMALARDLKPTFLLIHQWNEYGEYPDALTDSDAEPSTLYPQGAIGPISQEIAAYRAPTAPIPAPPPIPPSPPIRPPTPATVTVSIPGGIQIGGSTCHNLVFTNGILVSWD
jgi:hypothetical protein